MTVVNTAKSNVFSKSEHLRLEKSLKELLMESFNRAAEACTRLLMQDMIISRYRIEMITGEDFIDQLEDQMEEGYFASIIRLQNSVNTTILFLLTEEDGKGLYRILNGMKPDAGLPPLEDLTDSIGELNNILGNTFINCLANTLDQRINGSVPRNTLDLLGAILESVILQSELANKNIFYAEALISHKETAAFNVRLIILSDKNQLLKVLSRS